MPLERQHVGLGPRTSTLHIAPSGVSARNDFSSTFGSPPGTSSQPWSVTTIYLGPASFEKRIDPADQIANFCVNAAGQFPALVVATLVERAGFRPGRSRRVSGFVWAEELPSAFFQGGDETILRKELPR